MARNSSSEGSAEPVDTAADNSDGANANTKRGLLLGGAALLAGGAWKLFSDAGPAPSPRVRTAAAPAAAPPPPTSVTVAKPAWASDAGTDSFGRWADLTVGKVVQRMRWIVAGEFLMGSPSLEELRSDDEGPQHRVSISPGLWLADTACTQALWLAVMGGKNPARFSADLQNPVEQVSHLDVEAFLKKLQRQLPAGAAAHLPTEAEWEYACRAGTNKPFSFGAQITPQQVNYNGNHPYADAPKGLYREKTVPVKALPANAWGLHQMHGNVWEWCSDDRRAYTGQAVENPKGAALAGTGAARAIRGGSWDSGARLVRSAFRYPYRRDVRDPALGFRVALKSAA